MTYFLLKDFNTEQYCEIHKIYEGIQIKSKFQLHKCCMFISLCTSKHLQIFVGQNNGLIVAYATCFLASIASWAFWSKG